MTVNPITGASVQHDAAGNLINDGNQTYAYDATGQQTAAGTNLSQSYDGDTLRVKKIEGTTPTYYLRSTVLGSQVIAEIKVDGSWQRGFVYMGGQMIAVQQNAVAGVTGQSTHWRFQDPVTKSQRLVDASATVGSTIDLDPWGGETARSSDAAFQPQTFTSYGRDANGGDDAMMRRYQSSQARFAQPDPYNGSYDLTDPQSFNRYAYVNNDPVNFVDPSGLMPQLCIDISNGDGDGAHNVCFGSWVPFDPYEPKDRVVPDPQDPVPQPPPTPTPGPEDACSSDKNWDMRLADMREIAEGIGWGLRDNGKPYLNKGVSYLAVNQKLISMGFKNFINLNTKHFGGADWEGQINGRWYHLNVQYPRGNPNPQPGGGVPKGIDIHCEQYYERPSSFGHFLRSVFGF